MSTSNCGLEVEGYSRVKCWQHIFVASQILLLRVLSKLAMVIEGELSSRVCPESLRCTPTRCTVLSDSLKWTDTRISCWLSLRTSTELQTTSSKWQSISQSNPKSSVLSTILVLHCLRQKYKLIDMRVPSIECQNDKKCGEMMWDCTGRESNPGLPRGRREFYHWTTSATWTNFVCDKKTDSLLLI